MFETRLRLLLVAAGLPAPVLPYELCGDAGQVLARLDFAWPDLRVAIEADGREYHDRPEALYRDRRRGNELELGGWTVLRFTWADLDVPQWIVQQVHRALDRPTS